MKTQSRVIVLPHIRRPASASAYKTVRMEQPEPKLSVAKPDRRASSATKLFYIACSIFVLGIALGAVLVSLNDQTLTDYLSILIKNGIASRVTDKIYITFISCLIPHLVLMLLGCIFANCSFGLPFVVMLILFDGMSAGLTGGFLCRQLGAQGFLYNLLVLMPPTLIAAVAFLRFCVTAAKSSLVLYSIVFKGAGRNMKTILSELFHGLAVAAVSACAAAVLEAVLFKLLGGYFTL